MLNIKHSVNKVIFSLLRKIPPVLSKMSLLLYHCTSFIITLLFSVGHCNWPRLLLSLWSKVGRLCNEDSCGISGVGDRHRTGWSNGKGCGSALYITLQLNGLFVFGFIDIYVQCNYAEKHTVNILAIIVSPFLRHMRPREICYCLRLEPFNVTNRISITRSSEGFPTDCLVLEAWKVPHRLFCTRSLKSSPQTVLYLKLEKFPTDWLVLEAWEVPHRLSATRSLKSSP
jgi:hypothetical protein